MHEMPFKRVVLDIFVGKLDYLPTETEAVMVAAFPLEFDADFCAAEFCPALEVVDKLRKLGERAIHARLEIEP